MKAQGCCIGCAPAVCHCAPEGQSNLLFPVVGDCFTAFAMTHTEHLGVLQDLLSDFATALRESLLTEYCAEGR